MCFFNRKKRIERHVRQLSPCINGLLKLNESTILDVAYNHEIAVLRMIKTENGLQVYSESDALIIAAEAAKVALQKKQTNRSIWEEYSEKVATLLKENPFTPEEAEQCRVGFREYQKTAMSLFQKLVLRPDDRKISVLVRFFSATSINKFKEFSFDEETLVKSCGFSQEKDKESDLIAKIPQEEKNATGHFENEKDAEATNFVVLETHDYDGSNAILAEVKQDPQKESYSSDSKTERRKAIRAYFDSKPELAALRKSFEAEETFPGLIAKELIFAKEDEV